MILHVNEDHFIALLGYKEGNLLIFDNRTGLYDCTPEFFSRIYHWNGVAIILGPPSPYSLLFRFATPILFVSGILAAGWIFLSQRSRRDRSVASMAKAEEIRNFQLS